MLHMNNLFSKCIAFHRLDPLQSQTNIPGRCLLKSDNITGLCS